MMSKHSVQNGLHCLRLIYIAADYLRQVARVLAGYFLSVYVHLEIYRIKDFSGLFVLCGQVDPHIALNINSAQI